MFDSDEFSVNVAGMLGKNVSNSPQRESTLRPPVTRNVIIRFLRCTIFCFVCLQILSKKYLRCSARMMVVQLQKLLRMKLNIPQDKQVGTIIIFFGIIIKEIRSLRVRSRLSVFVWTLVFVLALVFASLVKARLK